MTNPPPAERKPRKIEFSVASISCVACTPAFKKGLEHLEGVRDVKQLPMLNKIIVEFDPTKSEETEVREEIFKVAERAGFKGKVIISR
ncbi:MAG: hypothetical protein ACYCPP_04990 [Nitrososphaerales archaeon]